MSDPNEQSTAAAPQPDLSAQLTRSLTSVWQQNAGAKPSSTNTELSTDRVKFMLAGAISGDPEQPVGEDEKPRSTATSRYRNEAIAAVTRITGRRVLGFIPKRDSKTDVASDIYLLEPRRIVR